MKTKLGSLIIIVILVGVLLTACSANRLVGSWVDSSNVTYTFYEDGRLVIGGLIPVTGTYEVLDGTRVMLTLDGLFGLAGGTVYDYKISGNRLTLSAMGVTAVLTRAD